MFVGVGRPSGFSSLPLVGGAHARAVGVGRPSGFSSLRVQAEQKEENVGVGRPSGFSSHLLRSGPCFVNLARVVECPKV